MANLKSKVPEETKLKVIEYYKTQKDNRAAVIAAYFGIPMGTINFILDGYFKELYRVKNI